MPLPFDIALYIRSDIIIGFGTVEVEENEMTTFDKTSPKSSLKAIVEKAKYEPMKVQDFQLLV